MRCARFRCAGILFSCRFLAALCPSVFFVLTLTAAPTLAGSADLGWAEVNRLASRTPVQRLALCLNYLNTDFGPDKLDGTAGLNALTDAAGPPETDSLWQACLPLKDTPRVSPELRAAASKDKLPSFVFPFGISTLSNTLEARNTFEALGHLLNAPENRPVRIRIIGHSSCLWSPPAWVASGIPSGGASVDAGFQDINLRLSLARAEFVRWALAQPAWTRGNPVRANRVIVEGRGFFEPKNGADFDPVKCDNAAERATAARKLVGNGFTALVQTLSNDREWKEDNFEHLRQQRAEVSIESPTAVRYGLRAQNQAVSRLVSDNQSTEAVFEKDGGFTYANPQEVVRFYPLGLRPSEYHTVDLGDIDDVFKPNPSGSEDDLRACWTVSSGWLQLQNLSEIDSPSAGDLWVRFRFVPNLRGAAVRNTLLLDLRGRPLAGQLAGETRASVVTLSLPAYWALRERLSPLLATLVTGIDRSQVGSALSGIVQGDFPTITGEPDKILLAWFGKLGEKLGQSDTERLRAGRSCLKYGNSLPGNLEAKLRVAIDSFLGRLPQTHEDLFARAADFNPHQLFARISPGMRLCIQPAATHPQDESNFVHVGFGISEKICSTLVDFRGDSGAALDLSPADNPVILRYPPPIPTRTNFGTLTVATNWSEMLFSLKTIRLPSSVFVVWPRFALYRRDATETFEFGKNAGWGDTSANQAFYIFSVERDRAVWLRLNFLLRNETQNVTSKGCTPQDVSTSDKQKQALRDLFFDDFVNVPGEYWWMGRLLQNPLQEAALEAGVVPHCVVVPRRANFTLQIPIKLNGETRYFDSGTTVGDLGSLLPNPGGFATYQILRLNAVRNIFNTTDRIAVDSDPSVLTHIPLSLGDTLRW